MKSQSPPLKNFCFFSMEGLRTFQTLVAVGVLCLILLTIVVKLRKKPYLCQHIHK